MLKTLVSEGDMKLLTGAYTNELVDALMEQFNDSKNIYGVYDALVELDGNGSVDEAYQLVRVLYDLAWLDMPYEAEVLCETRCGRSTYIKMLLSNMYSMI